LKGDEVSARRAWAANGEVPFRAIAEIAGDDRPVDGLFNPFRLSHRFPPLFDFDVLCRRFASVVDDFELDLLALIECGEAGAFHRRDMNEHVLSASLRLDKAVALGGVEPLYISDRHLDTSRILNNVLAQATVFGGLGEALRGPKCFHPAYKVAGNQCTTAR
jgi:hypothetical protein